MTTCEDHDDCVVVSDRPFCPVCREIESLKGEKAELESKVTALEGVIDNLKYPEEKS